MAELPMDLDTSRNEDPALPLDTESAPDESEEPMRCINCGVDLTDRRRRRLEPVEVLTVIRQWTAPQVVSIFCI